MTPLVVPWITLTWGWYWAFIVTGALGFLWLVFWLPLYRRPDEHPRVSAAELAHIRSDPPDPPVSIPWRRLLGYRQTWAFMLGKFLTDPIWWLYLFWIPDFLNRNHGLDLQTIGPPLVAIYLVADVGSIGGGWLSSVADQARLEHQRRRARRRCWPARSRSCRWCSPRGRATSGWRSASSASRRRRTRAGRPTSSRLLSDMFPRQAVGSVVGLGGMAGAVGGMLIAKLTGYLLQATGSYLPVFFIAAFAYLVGLAVIHCSCHDWSPRVWRREGPL